MQSVPGLSHRDSGYTDVIPTWPLRHGDRRLLQDARVLPLQPMVEPAIDESLAHPLSLLLLDAIVTTGAQVEFLWHLQTVEHLHHFVGWHAHIVPCTINTGQWMRSTKFRGKRSSIQQRNSSQSPASAHCRASSWNPAVMMRRRMVRVKNQRLRQPWRTTKEA